MASSPIPYALGIHTTTPQLGLCCSHPELGMTSQSWDLGRDMSSHLHEHLFSFVQRHDVGQWQFIAVAIGPGGFTSTRLGVVTARTLAQQLNIPLFGVSSLAAYVWHKCQRSDSQNDDGNVGRSDSEDRRLPAPAKTRIAVEMPARRGQVFGAVYDIIEDHQTGESTADTPKHPAPMPQSFSVPQLVSYKADHVINAEEWQHYLQTQFTEPLTKLDIESVLGYTVPSVIELATRDYLAQKQSHWSTVYPFYGQSPV